MSTSVFPTLVGLGWSATRREIWKTRSQEAISGKETRIADWSYPRHQWTLGFDFLRQGALSGTAYSEFAQLAGFFDLRQGMFDSFLYADPDDNAVTAQAIATGDGATTGFPLVRGFGGFVEPILAPNVVSHVYLGGVVQSPSSYSVSAWGATTPGLITFTAAPGSGVAISADFSFYFPCRFAADQMDFEKFMASLYAAKKVMFQSIK
ncbi:MAG TPA: DUF2460 domain-containing protein [Stellaceae bacterium]|jgi:uncharacterized protein (TIGR02217 family)|nr:DUF2460 domain-containing protein [Stellaceae bacterium]